MSNVTRAIWVFAGGESLWLAWVLWPQSVHPNVTKFQAVIGLMCLVVAIAPWKRKTSD